MCCAAPLPWGAVPGRAVLCPSGLVLWCGLAALVLCVPCAPPCLRAVRAVACRLSRDAFSGWLSRGAVYKCL